jgi:hypothetical protein
MEKQEEYLGWQDMEKLKEEGRILEAFIILVNWIERNLQFPIYYYYVASKKDKEKISKIIEKFEKSKNRKLTRDELDNVLNKEATEQERIKVWVVITRFWGSQEVFEEFKKCFREVANEYQIQNAEKFIEDISIFRENRNKVIHRLVEDRVTEDEVERYYDIGRELNRKIQQLHFKFIKRKTDLK